MALIDPIIQFQKERASVPFQPPTLCTAETFPLLLAGVPALRKTPGLATLEDAGEAYFTSIPYCLSGEDRQATRDHLEQVYGITNRDSMVAFCKEALLTNHEYLDFESFWEGRPSFSLEDLSPDARPVFQRLSDFARQFQPLVGRRGFLAWDISETLGHLRTACACDPSTGWSRPPPSTAGRSTPWAWCAGPPIGPSAWEATAASRTPPPIWS